MTRAACGLVLLLCVAGCGAPLQTWWEPASSDGCRWEPVEGTFFHRMTPPPGAPGNTRGRVFRVQERPRMSAQELGLVAGLGRPAKHGARVFRLLYLSQAPADVPRVVGALLAVPDAPLTSESNLVVRGHGTSGMADHAAPSLEPGLGLQQPGNPFSAALVAAGHVVIQTDYAGLGTHGTHPYMVLEAHAWAVLDSIRAAHNLCDPTGALPDALPRRVVMEGHSQGGHAILGALQFLASYGPEVPVLGAVLFSPAAEPTELGITVAHATSTRLVTPMAMSLVAYAQYHPGAFSLDDVFLPRTRAFEQHTDNLPIFALAAYTGEDPARMFNASFLEAIRNRNEEHPTIRSLRPIYQANTPGNFTTHVPLLLVHGAADDLISQEVTDMLNRRLCRRGNRVRRLEVAGASHTGVLADSMDRSVPWMLDRMKGLDDPGDCAAEP